MDVDHESLTAAPQAEPALEPAWYEAWAWDAGGAVHVGAPSTGGRPPATTTTTSSSSSSEAAAAAAAAVAAAAGVARGGARAPAVAQAREGSLRGLVEPHGEAGAPDA